MKFYNMFYYTKRSVIGDSMLSSAIRILKMSF